MLEKLREEQRKEYLCIMEKSGLTGIIPKVNFPPE
jgi:hypothetical protein